jgi:hypothetical protein
MIFLFHASNLNKPLELSTIFKYSQLINQSAYYQTQSMTEEKRNQHINRKKRYLSSKYLFFHYKKSK